MVIGEFITERDVHTLSRLTQADGDFVQYALETLAQMDFPDRGKRKSTHPVQYANSCECTHSGFAVARWFELAGPEQKRGLLTLSERMVPFAWVANDDEPDSKPSIEFRKLFSVLFAVRQSKHWVLIQSSSDVLNRLQLSREGILF